MKLEEMNDKGIHVEFVFKDGGKTLRYMVPKLEVLKACGIPVHLRPDSCGKTDWKPKPKEASL